MKDYLPEFKQSGARGVIDGAYTGDYVELSASGDKELAQLEDFVFSQLPGIVNGILPVEEDFGTYGMRGASDLGWGAILHGKSTLSSFRQLPSMWTADMVGVVLVEEKHGSGESSIIIKTAGFAPEDAAACLIQELAAAIKPHWPNTVAAKETWKTTRTSTSQKQAETKKPLFDLSSGGLVFVGGLMFGFVFLGFLLMALGVEMGTAVVLGALIGGISPFIVRFIHLRL
ncbi:MAG: hypothetical protein FWD55_07935 [Propionibacteriaceae bacterium]|nr:hypothetical protein [Propionibacteriaceae bacterium]